MNGEKKPNNTNQERFVRICRGEVEPVTKYEKVWSKYLERLKWESDPSNVSASNPPRKADEGFGGTREQHKQMRKAERSDFWKRVRD